jgi:YHS domain-containing protein
MAIDPICGVTVDEASALAAERDGQTFSFCSDHCRQKFLSTPATAKHEENPQGKANDASMQALRGSFAVVCFRR